MAGGFGLKALGDAEYFDHKKNTWIKLESMPHPRMQNSCVWNYAVKSIVSIGGNDGTPDCNGKIVQSYDLIKQKWYLLPPMNHNHTYYPCLWCNDDGKFKR